MIADVRCQTTLLLVVVPDTWSITTAAATADTSSADGWAGWCGGVAGSGGIRPQLLYILRVNIGIRHYCAVDVGAVWPNNWILCKVFGHFINDTFYVFPPHLIPFVIWVGLLVQRIFCLFRMVQLNQLSFWIILLADTHNAANNGAARVHSAACTL